MTNVGAWCVAALLVLAAPAWAGGTLTLNNLGNLNHDEHRNAEARKNFDEALAIYREFAARAPATYQPRLQDVDRSCACCRHERSTIA